LFHKGSGPVNMQACSIKGAGLFCYWAPFNKAGPVLLLGSVQQGGTFLRGRNKSSSGKPPPNVLNKAHCLQG